MSSSMAAPPQRRSPTYTYPFISPTFQSHQLLSPFYLRRITINDPNYHSYLTHSIASSPSHLNALAKRVQRYGDNGFFLHKDIPKEQSYIRTSLKRSEVRPWDQIVSRPILTPLIIDKESELPFPSQHPYTSHISQFALFPSTQRRPNEIHLRQPTPLVIGRQTTTEKEEENQSNDIIVSYKDMSTQTEEESEGEEGEEMLFQLQKPNEGPKSFFVPEKAFSKGLRLEKPVTMVTGTDVPCSEESFLASSLRPGIYRWDVSRAKPVVYQNSMTYPAPTTMYSPDKHGLTLRPSPLSQGTCQALETVNYKHSTTTTYNRHFTPPPPLSNALTLFKSTSQYSRPTSSKFMDSSRGKYARAPVFHQLSQIHSDPPIGTTTSRRVVFTGNDHTVIIVCDKSTQTNFDCNENENNKKEHLEQQEELITHFDVYPESEDGSYLRPSTAHSIATTSSRCSTNLQQSHHDDTRNSSVLHTPYNKSEAIQRFHAMYPDGVPDLRVYGSSHQCGRRHVINGYHAYYWH